MKKTFKKIGWALLALFVLGLILPQHLRMPVSGAGDNDYNHQSFWYYPWGKSIVHKGVDIFAKKGTPVKSSTYGLVLAAGELGKGGKLVLVLGPKWRLHYYAHLNEIKVSALTFVSHKSIIGTVGNTGNAATTPSHLHYGIATMIPYPWRIDGSKLGWQKMFYLNPIDYLKGKHDKGSSAARTRKKSSSKPSQTKKLPVVKEGDMIFQTSQSRQSPLIQKATQSPMSHCGIVVKAGKEYKVLEASNVVKLTSLSDFIAKGKGQKYWIKPSRLKGESIQYKQYLGKKYDLAFKFNNDTYYCSELIYDIYKEQFHILLCEPKPVKSYRIDGLRKVLKQRGIDENQLVVSPADLYQN